MTQPIPELRALERRSIAARAEYDRLRTATTQAQNAMVALYDVAKSTTDPVLQAALEGYSQFSESMLRTLESKLVEFKTDINECASNYAHAVYGIQMGDRIGSPNVTTTKEATLIDIEEMGIDTPPSRDGVHKQVYVAGPRVGKQGTRLKRSAFMLLGSPLLEVNKA